MVLAPYSGITLNSAKRLLRRNFEDADLAEAAVEASILLQFITGLDRTGLITEGTTFLSPEQFDQLGSVCERRLSGEPVDHILGTREFYGRVFEVSKHVLSPRQETEQIIDLALGLNWQKFCDIGTGSGAIAIALAAEREGATGLATDVSIEALSIAQTNADHNNVASQIEFAEVNWLPDICGPFDLIVSNPPYIATAVMAELEREVRDYDPALALDGGVDGLAPYREIVARLNQVLAPDGHVIFEIGYDQGEAVQAILQHAGFETQLHQDLSGLDRIIIGMREK